MEFKFKNFKEIINTKLDKLTWIDYEDSSITSEEGFSVTIDYYKNIGVNKDKNQLLVNVFYKEMNICAIASTDHEACDKFAKWFFDKAKEIEEKKDVDAGLLRSEGEQLFKNL